MAAIRENRKINGKSPYKTRTIYKNTPKDNPSGCLFSLEIVFLIVVIGTRYVSLGSVMGLVFYPIVLNAFSKVSDPPRNATACMISVMMATLVVFMHRENIKRIMNRTESKISFKKKSPAETAEGKDA